MTGRVFRMFAVLGALALSACATPQNHYDPLEPINRVTDRFNDRVDRITLKPLAIAWRDLAPSPVQAGVSNFFDNWSSLNTVLNDFLQGKGGQGWRDFGRFLVNSTLGIGGLFDVATPMGLEKHEEDLGQTLAVWGVGMGPYIVYPFFGPNSLRKTPDFVTSTATDGVFWASFVISPQAALGLAALKYIDKRKRLLQASK
ncbi:MAG: VacJ family lipoprotein, partial [Mariprofundaceae bacterium]